MAKDKKRIWWVDDKDGQPHVLIFKKAVTEEEVKRWMDENGF